MAAPLRGSVAALKRNARAGVGSPSGAPVRLRLRPPAPHLSLGPRVPLAGPRLRGPVAPGLASPPPGPWAPLAAASSRVALGSLFGRPGASSGPPPGSGPPGCGPLLRPSLPALSAGFLPRRGAGSGPSVGRAAALGAVGLGVLGSRFGRPWAPRPAPPLPRALRLLPPLRLASSAPAPSRRGLRPPPRRGFAARGPGPPRGRLGHPPGS